MNRITPVELRETADRCAVNGMPWMAVALRQASTDAERLEYLEAENARYKSALSDIADAAVVGINARNSEYLRLIDIAFNALKED